MSAVPEAREPSAKYLVRAEHALAYGFELLAMAPGGVAKLRELILLLAVRGKLASRSELDQSAESLLAQVSSAKDQLLASGRIKRDKPLPEVLAKEIPWAVPSSWAWVQLGELGQIMGGGTPKSGEAAMWNPANVPWLTPADLYGLTSKHIAGGRRGISDEGLRSSSAQLLPPCTVLFSSRAPIGYVAIASASLATNQGFKSCVPHLSELADYLYWFLKFSARAIDAAASGTTFKEISGSEFAKVLVPLPPLAEQHRIVARVEELMKLCDALEQSRRLADEQHARLTSTLFDALAASESAHVLAVNWQRIAEHFDLLLDRHEALDALDQTVLQLAAFGALTHQVGPGQVVEVGAPGSTAKPVPDGWSIVQFSDVYCELRYGTSTKCGYEQTGTPVLRIPNLQQGRIDTTDLKYGKLEPREVATLRLVAGDLLLIRSNGSASLVGTAALVGAESAGFAFAGYLMRVRLKTERVLPEYVALVLQTSDIRRQIEDPIRTTSGVKNVNSSEIARLTFLLPPLAEQHRIVARVEELRHVCAELRERLTAARRTQTLLADALVRSAQLSE